MEPQLQNRPAVLLNETEATQILACPAHPNNWIELHFLNGKHPDTTQFCNCCTGDCTPFCRNCDEMETYDA